MTAFDLLVRDGALPSLFPDVRLARRTLRVGAVQCAWLPDAEAHAGQLRDGIALAAANGAQVVLLQELTLSPYFCWSPDVPDALARYGEDVHAGPTAALARAAAAQHGICVHASLYECAADGRGFNTAICVGPDGSLLARTRKTHIPEFDNYHEDRYFLPAEEDCPVVGVASARFGFPTCWDQWFPELARALSLDGAEVIVYPTAIGSEPTWPDVDTQPMWHQTIVANGLANATFMVAVNRIGTEGPLTFYGSSFVSDPYGRVLVEAGRERPAVLVADLDLAQREEAATFGLLYTRRPERYSRLTRATDLGRPRPPGR